jgi:arginyl-tRNA synthetase
MMSKKRVDRSTCAWRFDYHLRIEFAMLIESTLELAGKEAVQKALGVEADPALKPTQDPKLGDYQFNAALSLAKTMRKAPRDVAALIAVELQKDARFASVEVAGPGFINVRLASSFLDTSLATIAAGENDGIPSVAKPEHVVVDFSSPNIAKQMHIGHIRSTIIGDSLARIARKVGHQVTADNHIGDWGTQFGLLIVGMQKFGSSEALEQDAIVELERVYQQASAQAKTDEAFATEARLELKKLQDGDEANRKLWEMFVRTTRATLDRVYAKLDVHFDAWLGESAYNHMLGDVCQTMIAKGVARENEGALCVFFSDHESAPADLRQVKEPFIVRKSDGAYLYATTDIATVFYRQETLKATRALYVVDARQGHHFKQLFAVCGLLGLPLAMTHIGFGTILGNDGKAIKTREGNAVKLEDVLTEGVARAKARIVEEGLDVTPEELDRTATIIGLGAIKYADLKQNRASDYVFDWDKMIAFKGNSGPYLQYAYARLCSIFRKAETTESAVLVAAKARFEQRAANANAKATPEEQTLTKTLLRFGQTVHHADSSAHPHVIADHLFTLAKDVSSFYEACPILKAESDDLRQSRLGLAALAARQLRVGLGLLGIGVVDRM